MLIILAIILIALSFFAQHRLKSKFEKYSKTRLMRDLSGQEVAQMMLKDNGIYDVKVVSVEGKLSDHYNPADKTVNLSHDVYAGRNAAAVAIAAHECGHAVQHASGYSFLKFRSAMVPALSAVNRTVPFLLIGGIVVLSMFQNPIVLLIGVIALALITFFSFVTLPVEFDASKRALVWLDNKGIVTADEHAMAKDALWWAASTYVIAALASLVTLLQYASLLLRRRD